MFFQNNFVQKNTPVHNLNPLIKFIVFLAIVFLLFLRISFLIQFLLMSFVALIVWKSDCSKSCRNVFYVYLVLFCFLFMVNFVFMKSPGFWNETSEVTFNDILGIYDKTGSKDGNKLLHGWFLGGEVLKKSDGQDWVGDASSLKCLESHLGYSSHNCTISNHSGESWKSAWQNVGNSTKWNIVTISNGNGGLSYAAFAPTWYTLSAFQFAHAFSLANKIIMIILLSAIFTATMPLSSFSYALEDFFRPLKAIKLPTKVMALAVAISIRFVPSLIMEASRITKAQASRGIDYKNGKLRDKASALLSLFVPLFVISFIKAGELSEAMTSRGYDHKHPRNSYRIYLVKYWELLVLFCSMAFISFLYFLFFNQYYFGLFSGAESLAIMAS